MSPRSKRQNYIMQVRRYEWISQHGPCQFCGSTQNLEVDHIDKSDKMTHKIWSYRDSIREQELAKCRVLCRPCHIKRHAEEMIVHGTRTRYERGCRCEPCVAKYREYVVRKVYIARQKREQERQARLNKSTS